MAKDALIGSEEWNRARRGETAEQRADRNLQELVSELRVGQMGVQILFGFLLLLVFQDRFDDTGPAQRVIYLITFLCCIAATALLIAPVPYHRTMFRRGRKEEVVTVANRFAQWGLFALFLAFTGAVLLVLDLVLSAAVAIPVTVVAALTFGSLWYAYPLYRRRHGPQPGERRPAGNDAGGER